MPKLKFTQETISNLNSFFDSHHIFTIEELDTFLSKYQSDNINTRKSILRYYKAKGRIFSIRRGMYACKPVDEKIETYTVDPYIFATKLVSDLVITHRSALDLLGKSNSPITQVTFTTKSTIPSFYFQNREYYRIGINTSIFARNAENFATSLVDRFGTEIRVTNFNRCFVDLLARPDLAGSWDNLWQSLRLIETLDLDEIYEYLLMLNNKTTFAKVGYYLEQRQKDLMVDEGFLQKLESHKPSPPHYFERRNRSGSKLLKRWNLLLPKHTLQQG